MFLLKIQIFSTIFHVITVTFCRKKRSFFSSFQEGKTANTSVFSFLFVPPTGKSRSWLSWNSFVFCCFHQNHPHGKREKYHHYKTNDDFPYPIGEKLHTPILFTRINTVQAHDIGFPSLEATLLNAVRLSRICRHFGFAMAAGGRKPAACSKMLIRSSRIWWTLVAIFPRSCYVGRNGLGTAWPGWEPDVKRPEYFHVLYQARKRLVFSAWGALD